MLASQRKLRDQRRRRRLRVKGKIDRFSGKPRIVVTRTNKHITAQLVDDLVGHTLVSASTVEKALADELKDAKSKVEMAHKIGLALGQRAKKKKISQVVFDRGPYLYHGRIKAVADGARESGLEF